VFPNSAYAHPAGSFTVPMTPPGVDPLDDPQTSVSFNCAWLPFVRGALTQLLLQSTWDTDLAGLGVVQSQVWRLINQFQDCGGDMCECLQVNGPNISKFVSDGHGGGSFVPVDPRTEGTVPAPWVSPPAGQTGSCLAGANLEQFFATMMGDASTKMGLIAELAAILVAFEAYLDLALGPFGAIIEIATEMAAGAIAAGATVMASAFDTATQTAAYNGIRCLLDCAADSQGRYSADSIANMKTDFFALIDGWVTDTAENVLWRLMFPDFLDSQGPNGLTLLGKAAGIVAYDCSDCDCGWCENFDFKLSDYTWFAENDGGIKATYVSGTGWVPNASVQVAEVLIGIDWHSTLTITDIRFSYESTNATSTHNANIYKDTFNQIHSEVCTTPDGNSHFHGGAVTDKTELELTGNVGSPSGFVITAVRVKGTGTPPGVGVSC